MKYHIIPVRMAIIKKSTNNKCWRQCGEKGILLRYCWECRRTQPLWKTLWRFLKKLVINLLYNQVTPLPWENSNSKRHRSFLLFSCPVVYNSLRPHGLQHARPPPSLTISLSLPKFMFIASVMPSSSAISSSDTFFSFCPWSFPESGTFPMSHVRAMDDQNTGASASPSVLPVDLP